MWQYFSYITFTIVALWLVSSALVYVKNSGVQKLGIALHALATLIINKLKDAKNGTRS